MTSEPKKRSVDDLLSLDQFLDREGIREPVEIGAFKKIVSLQLDKAIRDQGLSKTQMATRMGTSRAQLDRVLDPASHNVTLETLARAAHVVGRRLHVELI